MFQATALEVVVEFTLHMLFDPNQLPGGRLNSMIEKE
jgi:hypothetical protein